MPADAGLLNRSRAIRASWMRAVHRGLPSWACWNALARRERRLVTAALKKGFEIGRSEVALRRHAEAARRKPRG